MTCSPAKNGSSGVRTMVVSPSSKVMVPVAVPLQRPNAQKLPSVTVVIEVRRFRGAGLGVDRKSGLNEAMQEPRSIGAVKKNSQIGAFFVDDRKIGVPVTVDVGRDAAIGDGVDARRRPRGQCIVERKNHIRRARAGPELK